jgi:zinc protease
MRKREQAVIAFVLALLFSIGAVAQQTKQAPTPKAPASQGNQPTKPGPAQKTAREAAPAQAQPWKQIPIPPLPAFHPAVPKRVELANGMVLFLQEDHELPLVDLTARIRGGSRMEPAARVGLVDLYGDVWRTGGTASKTGDQLDDFLESRAAKLETGGGTDSTEISMNCLKADFEDVFSLFLDLLRNPAFRADKLELAQNQMYAAISRRNDDVGGIASREARFLAYGKDNPYARIPEYATVAAVNRDDLLKWHQQFVQPNNIILGVVGDFDATQMEARLRQVFEFWQKGPAAPRPDIRFNPAAPGYYYVEKEDVNQASVRMVALGIERSNPDYFAVSVMNEVFGGGMSSRLFKNIRTRQGLAYSVGGGIGAAFDHPGIFRLAMGTKTDNTAQAIKSLDEQVSELLKAPATSDELRRAKDAILNSCVL